MENHPITRAYLESLTNDDLIKTADNLDVDVPSDLDRVFIIGEILDFYSLDNESANPNDNGLLETVLVETVPLPKHYNITFIEIIIRDPLWAFVFWEIKSQDKEQMEKSSGFEGYFLKVSPASPEKNENFSCAENTEQKYFSVNVKPDDTAWYLGLSPAMFQEIYKTDQNEYKVELCAKLAGEETVLAVSSPVKLPELFHAADEHENNQIFNLSGFSNFQIVRNNERQLRQKRVETSNE